MLCIDLASNCAGAEQKSRMPNYDDMGVLYDTGVLYDDFPLPAQSRRKMAKVKLDLRNRTIDEKLDLGANIVTKMTGNATYTTPNPALASLTSQRTAILSKKTELEGARTNLNLVEEQLDALERDYDALLTAEGSYVQNVSLGDAAKILSAGMDVANTPAPIGMLPAPGNLRSVAGALDGQVECDWDPVRGAASYVAQCSTASGGPWTQFYTGTNSTCIASALVSGGEYFFRVAAIGAAGQGPWSDIARKRAT